MHYSDGMDQARDTEATGRPNPSTATELLLMDSISYEHSQNTTYNGKASEQNANSKSELNNSELYKSTLPKESAPGSQMIPNLRIEIPKYDKEIQPNGALTLRDSVGLRVEIGPEVDEKTRISVEFFVAALPQNLREKLAQANVPIIIAGKMSNLNPAINDKPLPPGDPRKSWDEVGAAYFDNKEWNMLGRRGVVITPAFVEFALVHESAHALDDIEGRPSHSQEFKALWEADLKSARASNLGINPYLAQPGNRGPEEAFAEVFDALSTSIPNAKQEQTLQTFPSLARFIQNAYFAKGIRTR